MCPEFKVKRPRQQGGSMLVIAIFIMVIMSVLVGGLSRLLQSSGESVVIEVLGTRAFYAAQSGMELGLVKLFPLDATPAQCSSVNPQTDSASFTFETLPGLNGCQVWLDCTSSPSSENAGVTHYRLSSTGSCDGGVIQSSRVIEMEVWQ
jgi:MSHA biogenesis protein MshP